MARRSSLRASDADRDGVAERLREATVEGRLAAHELEERLGRVFAARTYGELEVTVADLPSTARARRRPASRRAIGLLRAHPALLLLAIPVLLIAVATLIAITVLWAVISLLVLLAGRRGLPYSRGAFGCTPWRGRPHHAANRRPAGGFTPWL